MHQLGLHFHNDSLYLLFLHLGEAGRVDRGLQRKAEKRIIGIEENLRVLAWLGSKEAAAELQSF